MPREVLHGTRVFEREQVRGTEEGRGGLGVIMGERGCLRVVGGSGCVGGLGVIMGKRRYLIITHRDISYLNNMILQHIPYLYITIIHITHLYITIIHIPYLYISIIHITHLYITIIHNPHLLIITLIPIHQPSHATHLLALTLLHHTPPPLPHVARCATIPHTDDASPRSHSSPYPQNTPDFRSPPPTRLPAPPTDSNATTKRHPAPRTVSSRDP